MTTTERKNVARATTLNLFTPIFDEYEAVQFADNSFAILQNVEGEEFWTEISVKTKANKATKISPAFDPYEAAAAWQEDKRIKAEKKAEKERAKEKA